MFEKYTTSLKSGKIQESISWDISTDEFEDYATPILVIRDKKNLTILRFYITTEQVKDFAVGLFPTEEFLNTFKEDIELMLARMS